MPAFVTDGPDIPASLLQEHENGQVVFFCGAGISMPAGLPGFRGLVEQMYKELGTQRKFIEQKSFDKKQYDITLELLERRYPGGRSKVRSTLTTILKPKWHRENATVTHQALLQLAKDRKGTARIVTTNFDQIFSRVIDENELDIPILSAPRLPVPKTSRWHGVVHLHGLLPEKPNDMELNRLVLSSSDFGLAYLTERWAARFVSELFRNYTVCFVGYGINDPVLRYMMDALAADRLLGEVIHEAYAFAKFKDGDEEDVRINWEAKGVKPLLYRIPTEQDHSMLHRTLEEWADIYRDGIYGKQRIITRHASTPPLNSDVPDFGRDLVLWALTDELAAKYFADLNPVPPLVWIESLSKKNFGHDDLSRFDVIPNHIKDKELRFSILHRPTPYNRASIMSIADIGRQENPPWDAVMHHLARWLVRHLNDPKLFLWLLECGGVLNDDFMVIVGERIKEYTQLENENEHEELEKIRSNSPNAIPRKAMRTLWNLLLSGRAKTSMDNHNLYNWISRFDQNGLTLSLRIELREILAPCVYFRKPSLFDRKNSTNLRQVTDDIGWDIVLRCDQPHYALEMVNSTKWQMTLPDLLYDFTTLLHDTLALMFELGDANDRYDLSYFHQPSIADHPQNTDFNDWTILINLTRDAWIATAKLDSARAYHMVEHWWRIPYPVFKRLVFFAATHSNVISPEQALDWLLSDNHWWLWLPETRREVIRLVVYLAPSLSKANLKILEQKILAGPSRKMFRDNLKSKEWSEIVDYKIWFRLSKIEATGVSLGRDAKNKLTELKRKHPEWKLAKDESDEFLIYTETGNELLDSSIHTHILTPKSRRKLVKWLKKNPEHNYLQSDDWQQRCRDYFPTTAWALCKLAQEKNWPSYRWNQALQEWKEDACLKCSWRYIASIIFRMPDENMKEITDSASWWIENQAKTFTGQEELFFQLANRILRIEHKDERCEDPIVRAINHPIGHVTQGLLVWRYRQSLKNAEDLRDKIKSLFSEICDIKIERFRYGRIQLATNVVFLFRVDKEWTESHLLPLFDWNRSENEARGAWTGFLLAPRLYWPLLSVIKDDFLETASHYKKLGDYAKQYAKFITFLGLNHNAIFTKEELADAIGNLPKEGLKHSALTLSQAIEGAEEQKDEYWRNRVFPFIKEIWPKDTEKMDPVISKNFGHICLAAGNSFPHAFQELKILLMPVEFSGHLIRDLNKSNLCENFPDDSLGFLDAIIGENRRILLEDLKNCLDKIKSANPQLEGDHRFKRLNNICLRGKSS